MISPEFLQWSTAQINVAGRAAADLLIDELLRYALSAKGVEALGDGGGVAEEAAAERAGQARREARALHHHDVPAASTAISSSRRGIGDRGRRGAGEHGALHAEGGDARSRGEGFEASLSRSFAFLGSALCGVASPSATVTVRRAIPFLLRLPMC